MRTLERPKASAPTVEACPVCTSSDVSPEPYFYHWREKRFELHRCASCTHQYVWPIVNAEEQAAIYSDHYFTAQGDWVVGLRSESYAEADAMLRREADRVLGMITLPPQFSLLDIGCAGGTFLDHARQAGYRVAGIEYNAAQAQSARDRYRLHVCVGAIEAQPLELFDATPFGVVTVMDCLEHLPQPRALMERVARWTVPGAVLLIRGPLANSPLDRVKESVRRVLGREKQLDGYPLDAGVYNKQSLTRLVSDYGFDVERWIDPTPGFANMVARKRPH